MENRKQGPAKSRAFAFNRKVRGGKSRLNPFPPKTLHKKYPVGRDSCTAPPSNRTSHKPKHPNATSAATSSPTATAAAASASAKEALLLLPPHHPQTRHHPSARRSRRPPSKSRCPKTAPPSRHSIGTVLQRIAANDLDPRRAGLLLYGLQIASLNLPKPQNGHQIRARTRRRDHRRPRTWPPRPTR